jgi:Tol biopolymer transport system component/tRNA A-37 threonylcarbamoyl transferase component Bud32
MGEVYRARDARLGRDVAIKILPSSLTNEGERLKRFEQEARSVAALNHPNILTIYEIETHDGSPYLVSELLEGETLQQRLREGALPMRKALEIAVQAAHGIAAAHEKGIVHRDLKPANIFLTTDGRVKILDFGLAKLTQPDAAATADGQTVTRTNAMQAGPVTEEGVVLGTAGYMSPEQVRGKPADSRSDIFALGTILYEMLSGRRAFQRDSSADTMAAILKEDPPELSGEGKPIPPGVDRVVRHALEKNPNERFQSARDLAFDLESLSGSSTSSASTSASGANAAVTAAAAAQAQSEATSMAKKLAAAIAGLALLSIGCAAGWLYTRTTLHPAPPAFHRFTFRRGYVISARFLPDAQTAVYTASWEGAPTEVYEQRLDSPEARSMGLPPDTSVVAVSAAGEMAVLLHAHVAGPFQYSGTLASVAASGSAPRELTEGIAAADWSPDGKQLAVARLDNRSETLEFPIGKVLYRIDAGWVGDPRVSPDGKHIAFIDHDNFNDDGGAVAVIDLNGKKTELTKVWSSARGLAWHGDEIYFTATPSGSARALYGVTLSGRLRSIASSPGTMNLYDVAKDGRILFSQNDERIEMAVTGLHQETPRELGWLDWSLASDISADGKTVVFGESGEGAGQNYGIYIRKADGSPAIRLGDGTFGSISPDGKWVAAEDNSVKAAPGITVLPVGAGEARNFPDAAVHGINISWFPDSKTLIFNRGEKNGNVRVYAQSIDGGDPKPLTPENESLAAQHGAVSPDGKSFVALRLEDRKMVLVPLNGGAPKDLPMIQPGEFLSHWSSDGQSIFISTRGSLQTGGQITKVNLTSGKREVIKTVLPADRAGFQAFDGQFVSADGQTIVFSYTRVLSTLYILEPAK